MFIETSQTKCPNQLITESIVLSSRIRLARNFSGLSFVLQNNQIDSKVVLKKISHLVESSHPQLKFKRLIRFSDVSMQERMLMVEKRLISFKFSRMGVNNQGALILGQFKPSQDEGWYDFSLSINDEDHVRIEMTHKQYALNQLLANILSLDSYLEKFCYMVL